MCDSLDCIFDRMSEVIHRIDAPFIACSVVCHMSNTINNRVSHIHVRRCHINLSAEYFLSVCIFTLFHLLEKLKILFNSSVSVWALFTWLCKCSAVFTDLICCQVAYVCFSFLDQLYSSFIHLVKIIRCKEKSVFPVSTQPFDISFNRFYKFAFLFCRVCIIKTHVEFAVILLSKAIV